MAHDVITPYVNSYKVAHCEYCLGQFFEETDGSVVKATPGYVVNVEFNFGKPYAYLGKCYRCNHRDRP